MVEALTTPSQPCRLSATSLPEIRRPSGGEILKGEDFESARGRQPMRNNLVAERSKIIRRPSREYPFSYRVILHRDGSTSAHAGDPREEHATRGDVQEFRRRVQRAA